MRSNSDNAGVKPLNSIVKLAEKIEMCIDVGYDICRIVMKTLNNMYVFTCIKQNTIFNFYEVYKEVIYDHVLYCR